MMGEELAIVLLFVGREQIMNEQHRWFADEKSCTHKYSRKRRKIRQTTGTRFLAFLFVRREYAVAARLRPDRNESEDKHTLNKVTAWSDGSTLKKAQRIPDEDWKCWCEPGILPTRICRHEQRKNMSKRALKQKAATTFTHLLFCLWFNNALSLVWKAAMEKCRRRNFVTACQALMPPRMKMYVKTMFHEKCQQLMENRENDSALFIRVWNSGRGFFLRVYEL